MVRIRTRGRVRKGKRQIKGREERQSNVREERQSKVKKLCI